MGSKRRKQRAYEPPAANGPCTAGACLHGGVCARGACACAGAWGGVRCAHYVGHDHACRARCAPPALCAWRPTLNPQEAGSPYCVCPAGEQCPGLAGAGAAGAGAGGAVAGALLALALLVAAVWAALFLLQRRRHGSFVHARLADNVEISNPMYLADEDHDAPRANGGNHFANPVYESMYVPQPNVPTEEQANLLAEGGDSPPPPERAALL